MFLGHQLRELLTHTLVTLPLALGTCFMAHEIFGAGIPAGSRQGACDLCRGRREPRVRSVPLVASIVHKAQTYGQNGLAGCSFRTSSSTAGLRVRVGARGLLYLWPVSRAGRRGNEGSTLPERLSLAQTALG